MAASNADVGSANRRILSRFSCVPRRLPLSGAFRNGRGPPLRFLAFGLPLVGTLFAGGLRNQKWNGRQGDV